MADSQERGYPRGKPEAEWKSALSPLEYYVLREAGSEPPFSGPYWDLHAVGVYHCAGCGEAMFDYSAKFDAGTGWPTFAAPVGEGLVEFQEIRRMAEAQTAVRCSRCGCYLGLLAADASQPSGQRYSINSAALKFVPYHK